MCQLCVFQIRRLTLQLGWNQGVILLAKIDLGSFLRTTLHLIIILLVCSKETETFQQETKSTSGWRICFKLCFLFLPGTRCFLWLISSP